MVAQAEVDANLETTKSFFGREGALLGDWSVEGLGSLARAFWTTVLASLQSRKVIGPSVLSGQTSRSRHRYTSHGIVFDFRQSFGEMASRASCQERHNSRTYYHTRGAISVLSKGTGPEVPHIH